MATTTEACALCGAAVPNPEPVIDPLGVLWVICNDCLDEMFGCSACDAECSGHAGGR